MDSVYIGLLRVQKWYPWHFKKYSKDSVLANAEIEARRNEKKALERWGGDGALGVAEEMSECLNEIMLELVNVRMHEFSLRNKLKTCANLG